MEDFLFGYVILSVVVIGVSISIWAFSKAKRLIREWAQTNSYEIVSLRFCWLFRGPFFWRTGKSQLVYYVVVNVEGFQRGAYVKCGNFWLGMLSDEIEVRWD